MMSRDVIESVLQQEDAVPRRSGRLTTDVDEVNNES